MEKLKLNIQMFADGKITIETDIDNSGINKGLKQTENSVNKAGSTVKNIVEGLGITKLISKAMSTIVSSIDSAVSRVDTLNNFPKVMSNLGISSEDASEAIDKMSNKLAGLPTTLDEGASAVQRFTSKNGDVKKSTDLFLALNNAILAGGASSEIQSSALEQLSQSYAKGKPDMMEWRTAMTAMPAQLKQVAEAMGYVNADELGAALREGTVSMDDFMDTIVQLNEEGIDGFQSFEQQAKNSTGGIKTSIKVAKTQVVKGVADMIGGINKSLKKSNLPELSELISEIGKQAKIQLSNIANAISKVNFSTLINAIKVLIPIVGSLTAGFVAYNGALKVMEIGKKVGDFANLTKSFLTLTPAIAGSNTAMAGLNTTLAISPIGLVVASVAGFTAGMYLLSKAIGDNQTETQKITQSLIEYDNAMKEANISRQEYLDKNMNEIQNTENLYNELQALVDENGKVKEGYEDRVNFITGELSNALGIEIKTTDGVIQNYQEMKGAIDNVIQSKRAKVLLDAQEEVYNKAKDKQAELEKSYANAVKDVTEKEKERNNILKQIQSTYGLTAKQLKQVSETLTYVDENGKLVNLSFEKLGQQLNASNGALQTSNNVLTQTGQAYANNQQIIGNYEQALLNLSNGNYDAVLKMYEDTTNYHAKTNEETAKNYAAAIESQKQYLQFLKDNKNKYDEDVYNSEVAATEKRLAQLEKEQKDMNATISTGQTVIKGTWNKALAEQLSELTGKNIAFKKTANGHIQAYIDGQKEGAPMSKKQAKQFGEDMAKEIDKAKSEANKAGKNLIDGTTQGINNRDSRNAAFSSIFSFGNSLLGKLRESLQEHSPSKASRKYGQFLMKGLGLGVEDEKDTVLKDIEKYGKEIVNKMQDTISIETDKMAANVETSGTYQVAMAGIPNFELLDRSTNQTQLVVNGKVLAEVVNTENRNREVAKA